jgi:hypothetical protein
MCGAALATMVVAAVAVAAPVPWSHDPPGGLSVAQVPQFVAVTFDDGFGLEANGTGGVNYIIDLMHGLKNPGTGQAGTFDGSLVRTTFYLTSSNGADAANRTAWTKAYQDGHEAADHTISHPNGGSVSAGGTAPGRFSVTKWTGEIKGCKDWLTGATGIKAAVADIVGFRTPYLGYNDNVFATLSQLGFAYDSTFPNCFDAAEDAGSCSWPHTLDNGSKDADTLTSKAGLEKVGAHPGIMEVPVSTVFVPPDSAAVEYKFKPGLRAQVPAKMPYPSIWEPATGKLGGLDYTILVDAMITPDEMLAILKYTLDQHLKGNRSPFIFCAHTFMYSFSSKDDNPDTPDQATRDARWKALSAFIEYAHSKAEVRMRPVKDVVAWMQNPVSLAGMTGPGPDGGRPGTHQPDGGAGTGGKIGGGGADAGRDVSGTAGSMGTMGTGGALAGGGRGGSGTGGSSGGSPGGEGGSSGETGDTGGASGASKSGKGGGCAIAGTTISNGGLLGLLVGVASIVRRQCRPRGALKR